MSEDKDEEDVKLPLWYLQIKKGAGQLFAGCLTAELIILLLAKYVISENLIQILHMIIVPFGILCAIIGGFKGINTLNKFIDTYKKIKNDTE